jgi:prepilin-type N-terminal cleavage/methylation domain-containing protein
MKPSIYIAYISKQSQKGFSLLEISLVIALGAMVSIGYLYHQTQDSQFSNAKVQAGYYLTVNDAVGKYMLTYYDDLKTIPPNCAQVRLTAGGVPSAISSSINCISSFS